MMKRGDGAEDMEEIAAMEAELIQTQTNYRKLSEHFDSYKEEMHTALCKQNDNINSLERERKDLDCMLGNLDSPVLKAKSKRQTEQLTALLNNLKGCRQEILDELERLRKFNLEVEEVEEKLAAKRKEYGGSFGIFERRVVLQRRLMRLENQHYHVSVAFNSVLKANRTLREKITNLRCERRMFDKIYKRLADQLDACKQQKTATLIVSNMALEQRHEAQSKTQALKERNEKEQQTFETTMRILERSMRNDAKLSEFMTVKLNERQEFKTEEASKRDKAIRAALEADKRTLNQFKEAFECIQEVSDEKEVESMVKSFTTKEAENFALFNYITELDGQIEALQEELGVVRKDITQLQKMEEDEMKQHEQTMSILEKRYEEISREKTASEDQLKQVNKLLDELKEMIDSSFKESKCSVKTVEDILGLDTDISVSNMLVYLGQIEQKAIEMLNILHFISLKKCQETGKIPPRPDISTFVPRTAPDVGVVLPTPLDKEFEAPDPEEMVQVRLLTKNELTSLAMVDIEQRLAMMARFSAGIEASYAAQSKNRAKDSIAPRKK